MQLLVVQFKIILNMSYAVEISAFKIFKVLKFYYKWDNFSIFKDSKH